MNTKIYKKAALKYKPKHITHLFIAESPPYKKSGEELRYFYFEKVKGKDFLFRNIMQVLFPKEYETHKNDENKMYFLNRFREKGYFLIDACDYPINQLTEHERNDAIENERVTLTKWIKGITTKDTKIVLIKKNVYEILSQKLKDAKINVLNKQFIDFPSQGNQKKFRSKLKELL